MEITATTLQTVAAGSNILFTDMPICGSASILHREGSGIVTLRGLTNQARARFRVSFNGNTGLPAGGTVDEIDLAIAINGEGNGAALMEITPTATATLTNVSASLFIDVPACCCTQISVKNVGDEAIIVQNSNLIVERVA